MNKIAVYALITLLTPLSALGIANTNYSQRNVLVGKKFSLSFESIGGTPVQWYVLEPLGPGIKLLETNDATNAKPGRIGGGRVRTFTFEAVTTTEGTVYSIPFVKVNITKVGTPNMIVDSKRVPYMVMPK